MGLSTRYLHMKGPPLVQIGQPGQGQPLGYVDSTGISTGPHLHFGVRYLDDGSETTNIRYVTVSGWLMKSFQTGVLKQLCEPVLSVQLRTQLGRGADEPHLYWKFPANASRQISS